MVNKLMGFPSLSLSLFGGRVISIGGGRCALEAFDGTGTQGGHTSAPWKVAVTSPSGSGFGARWVNAWKNTSSSACGHLLSMGSYSEYSECAFLPLLVKSYYQNDEGLRSRSSTCTLFLPFCCKARETGRCLPKITSTTKHPIRNGNHGCSFQDAVRESPPCEPLSL